MKKYIIGIGWRQDGNTYWEQYESINEAVDMEKFYRKYGYIKAETDVTYSVVAVVDVPTNKKRKSDNIFNR